MKRLLHYLGGLLCIAGVIFVAVRLNSYQNQVDLSRFNATVWVFIGLIAMVYGAANVLLARAWWHLLSYFELNADWIWAVKTYGLSQLAKYVPGNIFHIAGRQALGMAAGLTAKPLAKSAVWELGLIAVAGALISVFATPLVWPKLSLWNAFFIFVALSGALIVITRRLLTSSVSAALLWQMIFLAISGVVFIGVLEIVVPNRSSLPPLPALCGAYVTAWLAGFITPGAPAGVGIREMVLLFLFGGQIANADLLLAVIVGRGVTVLGDLFYFMISSFLKKRSCAIMNYRNLDIEN